MKFRLVVLTLFVAGSIALSSQEQPRSVGKEACWTCHAPERKSVAGTPHEVGKSCKGCHGAGE